LLLKTFFVLFYVSSYRSWHPWRIFWKWVLLQDIWKYRRNVVGNYGNCKLLSKRALQFTKL
jgi:hypothetical protein